MPRDLFAGLGVLEDEVHMRRRGGTGDVADRVLGEDTDERLWNYQRATEKSANAFNRVGRSDGTGP